jgi:hypothetical protein
MKGFAVNKFNSKGVIIALIIAIVGALAAAWYFLWYVPHTPAYTLKIIHKAVQDKDADEVLRHVDIKSIVKNIVEREGNKYVDTSNPLGKATIAATKTFGPALIEDVLRKYIEDPDSFKSEPPTNNTTTQNDDNKSMVDRLVEGRLFKQHDVEIKDLKSEDNGNTATVTVTIQNNKKNMTKDVRVLMRHLGDGTWVIYDIPDIEDLYTITRK